MKRIEITSEIKFNGHKIGDIRKDEQNNTWVAEFGINSEWYIFQSNKEDTLKSTVQEFLNNTH